MENSIRIHKNCINLRFKEHGKNFTLDVPHKNVWIEIMKFLTKRGFKITRNEYYFKGYKCLSKYHKIGYKNDVAVLIEIGSSNISIEFGNKKNLWNTSNNFWSDKSDNRYTKLSYLENLSVKLEITKLFEFCEKYNHVFIKDEHLMSPSEFILNDSKDNKHIHGVCVSLDDLKNSIKEDSYNYKFNSNDANDKKIICGDTKYFYDYNNKRLSKGNVYHNINNMWWIISNDKLYNKASYELFDFDENLPRRKPVDIDKMYRILSKYEKEHNYIRCNNIYKIIQKLENLN